MARYDEMDCVQLLPSFMRADRFDASVCDVVDQFGREMSNAIASYSVWNAVDSMSARQLDALAKEMGIEYYDGSASVEAKRGIIKSARAVQAKLGTKWALQKVLDIYFSSQSRVVEWFDYDGAPGEPNHFTIETEYTPSTAQESSRFLAVLNAVKRKSSILDKVEAVIETSSAVRARTWLHDSKAVDVTARR